MVMGPNESSWAGQRVQEMISSLEYEYTRPSVMFKPFLRKNGPVWCASYGAHETYGFIEVGVVACGSSPDEAMRNFDKLWTEKPKNT